MLDFFGNTARITGVLCLLCAGTAHGQRMVAVDSSRALYEIDITTGATTSIGTVSSNASTTAGLAYDASTGTLYLSSTGNDSLYTLDLTTGTATLVGSYGDPTIVMHGLEFDDSTMTLYAASGTSGSNNNLFDVNTSTGLATLIGPTGVTSFTNLGYNSDTNVLYGTNSGADSFYSVDRATGAMTFIGLLNTSTNPNGLAYNRDNGLMYMVDNTTDMFYTVDMATGSATAIGSTGPGNLLGLVYIPVPEPAGLLTALAGLVIAGMRIRGSRIS